MSKMTNVCSYLCCFYAKAQEWWTNDKHEDTLIQSLTVLQLHLYTAFTFSQLSLPRCSSAQLHPHPKCILMQSKHSLIYTFQDQLLYSDTDNLLLLTRRLMTQLLSPVGICAEVSCFWYVVADYYKLFPNSGQYGQKL